MWISLWGNTQQWHLYVKYKRIQFKDLIVTFKTHTTRQISAELWRKNRVNLNYKLYSMFKRFLVRITSLIYRQDGRKDVLDTFLKPLKILILGDTKSNLI